jgi:nucleotide-binding universal stress UspA family protein
MTLPGEPGVISSEAAEVMERVERAHAELRKEATAYLTGVAERLRASGLRVQTQVAIEEKPDTAILNFAKPPIDMIALETHGRGGIVRILLGSVADKVVRGSKLPILIHKGV